MRWLMLVLIWGLVGCAMDPWRHAADDFWAQEAHGLGVVGEVVGAQVGRSMHATS